MQSPAPIVLEAALSGVSGRNPDGRSRQELLDRECAPGDPVLCSRDTTRPYDRYAIAVYSRYGSQIGYFGREAAEQIGPVLDAGGSIQATIVSMRSGLAGNSTVMLNVKLRADESL